MSKPSPSRRASAARRSRRAVFGVAGAAAAVGVSLLAPASAPALAAPSAAGEWQVVETRTAPHLYPRGIAASPDGAHLFIGSQDENALSVIDLATGTHIDLTTDGASIEPILTVPTPDGYRVLAAGTNHLYAVTSGTWDVAEADAPGIEALAYSEHTETAFSISGGDQLSEHDPLTGEILLWTTLDDPLDYPALAADPRRAVLYATSNADGTLTAIDLGGLTDPSCACDIILEVLDLPPGTNPVDVAISPDGTTLYVLDSTGMLFSLSTDDLTAPGLMQQLDGYFATPTLSVNPVTGEIVAVDLSGTFIVVDPETFQVSTEIAMDMGLWDTAISTDGKTIFVTNNFNSTISALERVVPAPDPATNVRATGGARQAAVFWEASPSAGVEYAVTAAGETEPLCITSGTFCIVTGLAPGTLQFTVTATNAGGSAISQPSAAVTIVAPAAPSSVPTASPSVTVAFAGSSPDAAVVGQTVQVIATGFAPGSYVDVSLHSLPVLIGSGQVGAGGSVTINAAIPTGTPPGAHHLVASGFTAAGAPASAVRPITLTAAPNPSGGGGSGQGDLARTGSEPGAALLAWCALALLGAGAAIAVPRVLQRGR